MRAFTVEARSLDSARAIHDALGKFHPELLGSENEGYRVSVDLHDDSQVVAVLNALDQHVTQRNDGSARVELDGRRYTMHVETAG